MDGQDSSLAGSNSSAVAAKKRRGMRHATDDEQEGGDAAACTGRSCQACTAGAIADCVAVCCCPCGLVNFFALTFLKLPWAVARRCVVGGRKNKKKSRRRETAQLEGMDMDRDAICEEARAEERTSEIALSSPVNGRNDKFGAEFKVEDVWLEVGHMGFGRVSFTGAPVVQGKGE